MDIARKCEAEVGDDGHSTGGGGFNGEGGFVRTADFDAVRSTQVARWKDDRTAVLIGPA